MHIVLCFCSYHNVSQLLSNAFVSAQVYGFSWIVLLVMVLLFKVSMLIICTLHIACFQIIRMNSKLSFCLISAFYCNSEEVNCLADFYSVSAGHPCSWDYCWNSPTYCIYPVHYCRFVCKCTCFYSNWLVCFMCKCNNIIPYHLGYYYFNLLLNQSNSEILQSPN